MALTQRVAGYRLLGRLKQGGMAELWLAHWQRWQAQRTVVLKFLPPARCRDPELRRLFRREVAIVANLQHANIVQLLDAGTSGSRDFAVFEHIDCASLRDVLKLGPLSPAAGANVAVAIARALGYAHEQNPAIVHCDVSPENIVVDRRGTVKLCDFGVARSAGTAVGDSEILRGKPAYLAPELLTERRISPAADQFALGLVLYECLTGQAAYDCRDPDSLLTAVRQGNWNSQRPSWQALPLDIQANLQKMLALNVDARFGDLNAVATIFLPLVTETSSSELGARVDQALVMPTTATPTLTLPLWQRWRSLNHV